MCCIQKKKVEVNCFCIITPVSHYKVNSLDKRCWEHIAIHGGADELKQ